METNLIWLLILGLIVGVLGSLLGIGGGLLLTPFLTLVMGIDIKYAIATSLINIIATSSGASINYLKSNLVNLRLSSFLEIFTTLGAVIGALLTGVIKPIYVSLIFGSVLIFSAFNMLRKIIFPHTKHKITTSYLADKLQLTSYLPNSNHLYPVTHVILGSLTMLFAGIASGLLGIGSGAFKVIALDNIMKVPLKVATATSTLMMGITASCSAFIYLFAGNVKVDLVTPIIIGSLIGAVIGSYLFHLVPSKLLRIIFIPILILIGLQMIFK